MSELRRQLQTGDVWSGKNDLSPLDGLEREAARADADTRAAWAEELAELLTDPDPTLRTRAVAALDHVAVPAGTLVELLERRAPLYRGVQAQGHRLHPEVLEDALYQHLARECAPEARPALRRRVRQQPGLAVFMAEHDTRWLVGNAREVVDRKVLGGVLRRLPAAQRPRLLEKMGPWPDAAEILARPWWRTMPDAETLRAIIAG